MLSRFAVALTALALCASSASGAAAAGKGKPRHRVHVAPYKGPLLAVTPLKGKPGTSLTVTGTRFAPSKRLHAEIDCPMFGRATHGSWSYTVHTSSKGSFTLRLKFPTLKKAHSGICNVYVLNTTARAASWISTGFNVA